jgi:hypothetical protein
VVCGRKAVLVLEGLVCYGPLAGKVKRLSLRGYLFSNCTFWLMFEGSFINNKTAVLFFRIN